MWLTNSSVGRKVVMSVTGLFLVLFVTFHALMNAVAIVSFDAYDAICEFLGANWYAVLGTGVIAVGMLIHLVFAFWLTYQNRKARGGDRYAISKNWKSVSWASQNMLVIGIIVLCFVVLHLVQFWAKMQVPELLGEHVMTGKYYLRAVFSQVWVLPVYLVGFAAIWLHITHGFWSAFQTLGVANDKWICRWKCIASAWATVVFVLFAAEACYFTYFFAC